MKRMTIWQRINAGMAVLILLLLAGVGLAFWAEQTRSAAQHRSDLLNGARDHIQLDFAQMNGALRGILLDSKDEVEKQHLKDAQSNLSSFLDSVLANFAASPDLSGALTNLREFASHTLATFQNRVQELADNSASSAASFYQKNYSAIRQQRDHLIDEFDNQVQKTIKDDSARAQTVSDVSLGAIILILMACIVVGHFQSKAITGPLAKLAETLDQMRQGDFTGRLPAERQDEFGVIGRGLNRLADDLSVLVGQVQRSGIQVNMTATEIAATAKQQQSTTNEIAATTSEIGATSKEIAATSRELVKTMNEVSDVAEETTQLANTGQTGITRMESTMRQIMEASSSITNKLAVLNEKTANINSVVTTITKVADQTNLLSLNAAIEAEKAGEYGLGFAVVAMEIRRLADQTAVATYDIEKMVKEMQSAVTAGVMGMDKFSEEVRHGVEEIRQVSTHLAQIIHQVQALTPRFQTVNEGMHAQANGALQISETLTQLGEAAQQTAESLRQSNLAIEQLNEAAHSLQSGVAKFKLPT